jgi:hypothetical protein
MNTQNEFSSLPLSPSDIDAAMARARAERAEVMRAALNQVPALFKRLTAGLKSKCEPQPRRRFSAWA